MKLKIPTASALLLVLAACSGADESVDAREQALTCPGFPGTVCVRARFGTGTPSCGPWTAYSDLWLQVLGNNQITTLDGGPAPACPLLAPITAGGAFVHKTSCRSYDGKDYTQEWSGNAAPGQRTMPGALKLWRAPNQGPACFQSFTVQFAR